MDYTSQGGMTPQSAKNIGQSDERAGREMTDSSTTSRFTSTTNGKVPTIRPKSRIFALIQLRASAIAAPVLRSASRLLKKVLAADRRP